VLNTCRDLRVCGANVEVATSTNNFVTYTGYAILEYTKNSVHVRHVDPGGSRLLRGIVLCRPTNRYRCLRRRRCSTKAAIPTAAITPKVEGSGTGWPNDTAVAYTAGGPPSGSCTVRVATL
jgi:hypothetical protein